MMRYQTLRLVLPMWLLTVLLGAANAASIWDEVPPDALGAVVVRNLAQTDARAQTLLRALQRPLPGPLTLLNTGAGIDRGLDEQGDLLLVVLPPHADGGRPQLGVWLPVSDFDQIVRSLDGTPREQITAVTIAGEDLLIGRHGDWAVVMDPVQRMRLSELLDAAPTDRHPLTMPSEWDDWAESNAVTAVLFESGVERALSEIVEGGQSLPGEQDQEPTEDDLFGAPAHVTTDPWQAARATLRSGIEGVPGLSQHLQELTAVGVGLTVDQRGNAKMGMRLAWPPASASAPPPDDGRAISPPVLYTGGSFVVATAGRVSRPWAAAIAELYAQLVVRDLRIDAHNEAAQSAVRDFRQALAAAAEQVVACSALTRPGDNDEGVYTNSYLAVRVDAADTFLQQAAELIATWNELVSFAQDELQLQFASETVQVAGRAATQYSVDMVEATGGAALPELRQSMQRLFGPNGKLRLQLVAVDEQTVLMVLGTEEQTAKMVDVVARGGAPRWDQQELQPTSELITDGSGWQLFVSLQGYVRWLQRQMDAILGPMLGGPFVKDFTECPPVGVVGGRSSDEVWIEVVAPAETIEACGDFARD